MPLVEATFTLIFLEWPAKGFWRILSLHFEDDLDRILECFHVIYYKMPAARRLLIRDSVNNPSERLAAATEAILTYFFDDEIGSLARSRHSRQDLTAETAAVYANLLDALLWAIPRAGISEKIALYSGKTLPRGGYEFDDDRISLLEKYLDEHAFRVKDAKLATLAQRIENGESTCLVQSDI